MTVPEFNMVYYIQQLVKQRKSSLEGIRNAFVSANHQMQYTQSHTPEYEELRTNLNRLKMQVAADFGITSADIQDIHERLNIQIDEAQAVISKLGQPDYYVVDMEGDFKVFGDKEAAEDDLVEYMNENSHRGTQDVVDDVENAVIVPVFQLVAYDVDAEYEPGDIRGRRENGNEEDKWMLIHKGTDYKEFSDEQELLEAVRDEVKDGEPLDNFSYEYRQTYPYYLEERDNGKFTATINE